MSVKVTLEFSSIAEAINYLNAVPTPWQAPPPPVHIASAPTAAPVAAATEVTVADVNKAMVAYIGKGAGRTAATAKAIMTELGVDATKNANPAQLASLLQAFQTR